MPVAQGALPLPRPTLPRAYAVAQAQPPAPVADLFPAAFPPDRPPLSGLESTGFVLGGLPGLDEYSASLVAHPFATNIATAAFLAFLGDAIAQRSTGPTYDRVRAVSFVLFDAFYRGGFQTVAFPAIIEGCRGDVLQAVADGLSISTDPAILAAIERTAFNQFLVVRLRPLISQKFHHDVMNPDEFQFHFI